MAAGRPGPRSLAFLLALLWGALGLVLPAYAGSIQVNFHQERGAVNRWVFGSNQVAYDPTVFADLGATWHDGFSNYGAGLWDPALGATVPAALARAQDIGLSVSRFPGGLGTQIYDWHQAVGPPGTRPDWQFGPVEFLQTCDDMAAEPLITLTSFVGTPQDLADFVAYLNAPDDGTYPWAAARTADGYPEPFGVTYFEFGNECYVDYVNGQQLRDIDDYIDRFNATSDAIKAVDPSVKLGVVLTNDDVYTVWNARVLEGAGSRADFVVIHTYPTGYDHAYASPETTPESVFECVLAAPAQLERILQRFNEEICARTGRDDLRIAVTEFNNVFIGDDPVPYRHCLGNALLNAEYLRVFTQPRHDLLMANFWQFINEYFGQFSGPVRGEATPYVNRPQYYPFHLYAHHFGTTLVDVKVECDTYESAGGWGAWPSYGEGSTLAPQSGNLIAGQPWFVIPTPGVDVTQTADQVSLVFSPGLPDYGYTLMSVDGQIAPGKHYRLSAQVKFSRDRKGIDLYLGDGRGYEETQSGSLSSSDWVWKDEWVDLHVDYQALDDATGLLLLLYRPASALPDVVHMRNWALHEITPDVLPATPCLSVNASKSDDGQTAYLVVVNKDLEDAVTVPIRFRGFEPQILTSYVLNGPSIDAINESDPDTVAIHDGPSGSVSDGFEFTFEPHSMTAIEIQGQPVEPVPASSAGALLSLALALALCGVYTLRRTRRAA